MDSFKKKIYPSNHLKPTLSALIYCAVFHSLFLITESWYSGGKEYFTLAERDHLIEDSRNKLIITHEREHSRWHACKAVIKYSFFAEEISVHEGQDLK